MNGFDIFKVEFKGIFDGLDKGVKRKREVKIILKFCIGVIVDGNFIY